MRLMNSKHFASAFIWALLATTAVWITSAPIVALAKGDQIFMIKENDPKMSAAIKEAQGTLDDFLKLADNPAAGTKSYMLKVAMPYRDNKGGDHQEHIFVAPFKLVAGTKDRFSGELANQPNHIEGNAGDEVRFNKAQISDWAYRDKDGKLIGARTVRVIVDGMPEDQAKKARAAYKW
jgi:uncharacterized protein YegJ (DUF2314 family)